MATFSTLRDINWFLHSAFQYKLSINGQSSVSRETFSSPSMHYYYIYYQSAIKQH